MVTTPLLPRCLFRFVDDIYTAFTSWIHLSIKAYVPSPTLLFHSIEVDSREIEEKEKKVVKQGSTTRRNQMQRMGKCKARPLLSAVQHFLVNVAHIERL